MSIGIMGDYYFEGNAKLHNGDKSVPIDYVRVHSKHGEWSAVFTAGAELSDDLRHLLGEEVTLTTSEGTHAKAHATADYQGGVWTVHITGIIALKSGGEAL